MGLLNLIKNPNRDRRPIEGTTFLEELWSSQKNEGKAAASSPESCILFPSSHTAGFEIEFGKPGEYQARLQPEITRCGEIKYDGTVPDGFELASKIYRFNDFTAGRSNPNIAIWDSLFKCLNEIGATTESGAGAGMHIHIGRTAFNNSVDRIYNTNQWMIAWQKYLVIIGERAFTQYCRAVLNDKSKCLGGVRNDTRYRIFNVCPSETVEMRFFKSVLTLGKFLRNMQFAISLAHFSESHDTTHGNILADWTKYVSFCDKYRSTYPVLCEFFSIAGFIEKKESAEVTPAVPTSTVPAGIKVISLAKDIPHFIKAQMLDKFLLAAQAICTTYPTVNLNCIRVASKHVASADSNYMSLLCWVNALLNDCSRDNCDRVRFE